MIDFTDMADIADIAEIHLERRAPERNMARFYTLCLERDLFGRIIVIRRWGRIGGRGRERAEIAGDLAVARARIESMAAAKRRRGYR